MWNIKSKYNECKFTFGSFFFRLENGLRKFHRVETGMKRLFLYHIFNDVKRKWRAQAIWVYAGTPTTLVQMVPWIPNFLCNQSLLSNKNKKKINHTFLTNIDHWNIKNEQSWIKEIYAWTYDLFISLINEIRWSITRIPGIPTACFLFNIFLAFSCKKMFFATIKCKKCSIFHNWILKFFNYKDAIGSLHFAITKI